MAPEGYPKLKEIIPLRYFIILLTTTRWNSLGLDWNLEHTHMFCMISSLLVVRYNKDHIIPLYIVWLTFVPDSSLSKKHDVAIPNFFKTSLQDFLAVLGFWYEGSTFLLLDLLSKKECQFSYHWCKTRKI